MGWWVLYSALCAALAVICRGRDRLALCFILCGLLVAQLPGLAGLGPNVSFISFAVIWVIVSGAIVRHAANKRHLVTSSGLTLVSAMCYGVGRAFDLPFSAAWPVWHSILFWADMAGICAILAAGWHGIRGAFIRFREAGLGLLGVRRDFGSVLHRAKAIKGGNGAGAVRGDIGGGAGV